MQTGSRALAIALLAACGGPGGGSGGATSSAPPVPQLRKGPLPARDVLAALPRDAAFVIGVDIAGLRTSQHFADYAPLLLGSTASGIDLHHACLDLLEDVSSLVFAFGPDLQSGNEGVVVVTVAMSRDRLHDCFENPPEGAEAIAVDDDGALTRYRGSQFSIRVRWLSTRTFIASAASQRTGKPADMGAPAANLTGNRGVMALIGRTDTKAMLWMVGDLARLPELSESIEIPGGPVTAVVGSGNLPGALDARVAMSFSSSDAAAKASKYLMDQLAEARRQPMVGGYLSGVSLAQSGTDVEVAIKLDDRSVGTLVSMLKLAIGGNARPTLPGQP